MLVDTQHEFTPAHLDRWLTLLYETLDHGWTGPDARHVRDLADNVARVHGHQLLAHAVSADSGASTRRGWR